MDPKLIRLLPLLILLAFTSMMAFGLFNDPDEDLSYSLVGRKITDFDIPILGEEGTKLSPKTFSGQVAILHVFASWCPSCAAENQLIMRIAQTGKVAIYGLAWKNKPEDIIPWLNQHGNPYQKIGVDLYGRTTIPLSITGTPETFVIDKAGSVYLHFKQPLTDDVIDRLILPLVDKLNSGNVTP